MRTLITLLIMAAPAFAGETWKLVSDGSDAEILIDSHRGLTYSGEKTLSADRVNGRSRHFMIVVGWAPSSWASSSFLKYSSRKLIAVQISVQRITRSSGDLQRNNSSRSVL